MNGSHKKGLFQALTLWLYSLISLLYGWCKPELFSHKDSPEDQARSFSATVYYGGCQWESFWVEWELPQLNPLWLWGFAILVFQCQKPLDIFIRYHCPYWLNVTLLHRWVFVSFHVRANHQHCSRDHTIVLWCRNTHRLTIIRAKTIQAFAFPHSPADEDSW